MCSTSGNDPAVSGAADGSIYRDPSRPLAERVSDLVSRMTLPEKVSRMTYKAPAIPRLGVPAAHWWNQCLSGVVSPRPTTQFPACIGLAATWDPDLVREVATAISDEARALYVQHAPNREGTHGLFYRAPVINISRDPRWGRIHEVWGEDPCLTSRLGVAYVRGLQGDHPHYLKLVSTLKHFACNNEETRRLFGSSEVPERVLREYWLPHFRACITEAGAWSIMAAYNGINGVPCNINRRLLTEILRDEWGFAGFVVSDTGAIRHLVEEHHTYDSFEEAAAEAVKAGVDLDSDQFDPVLVESVRRGLVTEADIDRAVSRILEAQFRLGVFDPAEACPYNAVSPDVIEGPAHLALSRRANRDCMVLLRNEGGLLPLERSGLRSVALIGPHADRCYLGPGYVGKASNPVTPLAGLRAALPEGVTLRHEFGCDIADTDGADAGIARAAAVAAACDAAIVVVGTDGRIEAESRDRTSLGLPGRQESLVAAVLEANPRTVLVLVNGGPPAIPRLADRVPAILETFFGGSEFGHALAEILLGDATPGGKLPYTVYRSADDLPPPTEYDVRKGFTYLHFRGVPQFPFEHGLSYTGFEYRDLRVPPDRIPPDGRVCVSLTVTNTGYRAGDEVVQLYTSRSEPEPGDAIRQLRGFRRLRLEPGQTETVRFDMPATDVAVYDETSRRFVVRPGVYEVLVGSSSADIRLRARVTVL